MFNPKTSNEITQTINSQPENLSVNVSVLDKLVSLAGELVLTRNQLVQSILSEDLDQIGKASQRVDLVTSEIQTSIMSTRMQPVGTILSRYKQIVHEMSTNQGKAVELNIEGEEVELDKTIIELISDPITHLVKNAVDHGIEMPDARLEAGKSNPAIVNLKTYHEAGQVFIEISDDGAGIDLSQISAKLIERGTYTENEIKEMPDSELIKTILEPGFSLSEEASKDSGLGIGLDVVNTNLTKLGGTLDIKSTVGKGTTVRVKLPLTLAIIPSLIVLSGSERFTIPQVSLVELVRIPPEQVKSRIEKVDNASVIRLRNELLPLLRLSDVLEMPKFFKDSSGGLKHDQRELIHDRRSKSVDDLQKEDELDEFETENRSKNDRRSSTESAVNIVVVNAGEVNYGIVVDALLDSEEIVVKPLGYHLRDVSSYAGATILGDGKSALILDIVGISNLMSLRSVKDTARQRIIEKKIEKGRHDKSLLVVKNAATEYFALPLGLISRLEKINRNEIEAPGGQLSIKYRGANLLLFKIEDTARVAPIEDVESPYVIVFQHEEREVGVLVSGILDTIDTSIEIDDKTFRQPGILGSAHMMDQTTMLLDLHELVG